MRAAVRSPERLWKLLQLPPAQPPAAQAACQRFRLVVPALWLDLIEPGNLADPLLRQVYRSQLKPLQPPVTAPTPSVNMAAATCRASCRNIMAAPYWWRPMPVRCIVATAFVANTPTNPTAALAYGIKPWRKSPPMPPVPRSCSLAATLDLAKQPPPPACGAAARPLPRATPALAHAITRHRARTLRRWAFRCPSDMGFIAPSISTGHRHSLQSSPRACRPSSRGGPGETQRHRRDHAEPKRFVGRGQ